MRAMLPEPPRPVVTTDVLRTGVLRSAGVSLGDLELSAMLPAPPRPWEETLVVILTEVVFAGGREERGLVGSVCVFKRLFVRESGR